MSDATDRWLASKGYIEPKPEWTPPKDLGGREMQRGMEAFKVKSEKEKTRIRRKVAKSWARIAEKYYRAAKRIYNTELITGRGEPECCDCEWAPGDCEDCDV